jgi:hypothetical protein
MKSRLMYVERKTGVQPTGQAWIGRAYFSKTGKTVYFNGKAFLNRATEAISRDTYWISGVKKNGEDRHQVGPTNGKIIIDRAVVEEYLQFRGLDKLPNIYEVTDLDNTIYKDEYNKLANETLAAKTRAYFSE